MFIKTRIEVYNTAHIVEIGLTMVETKIGKAGYDMYFIFDNGEKKTIISSYSSEPSDEAFNAIVEGIKSGANMVDIEDLIGIFQDRR